MARFAVLKTFYASENWQLFRMNLINERALKYGRLTCEHCREPVARASQLTVHHIEELTPENVHDAMISLNPENCIVVHHECHNEIHRRFGHEDNGRHVYLVYGPPMSGKTTFVKENIKRADIVVDIDRLYEAVSMRPSYDKPNQLYFNVVGIQTQLIDNIKTRYGKWRDAWIVGGYPDKYTREKLANDLGAELVFCDVSQEECLRRLALDEERKYRQKEWAEYIQKWFEKYSV